MNTALQQFPGASPHKDLFQKYAASKGCFDSMLLGDSITDLLNVDADPQGNPGGRSAVEKYLSVVKIANFGTSGDSTQAALWCLQNGEGRGCNPRAVMVRIGPNDSNRLKLKETNRIIARLDDQKQVRFPDLNAKFPGAKRGLIGFFPGGNLHPVEQGFAIWISSVAPTLESWVRQLLPRRSFACAAECLGPAVT